MNICVFAGSAEGAAPEYAAAARDLGRLLARGGHCLVFGGGARGLMGACAEGAAEEGGEILGIAPRFFDEPGILYPGCTRFLFTDTMSERKTAMAAGSDAFIALPGGIGTLEEFFEIFTLKQLGRHGKPIALVNTLDYYAPLSALLERAVRDGFLSRRCFSLFSLCPGPEEALRAVCTAPASSGVPVSLREYSP